MSLQELVILLKILQETQNWT